MAQIPAELKYAITHEWVRLDDDGYVTIGITDHAQSLLGDIVFIEAPATEAELIAGEEAGVIESVKAASDIYTPISGKVVTVNETLSEAPEHVNNDPYGEGWLFRIEPSDISELETLLDAEAYATQVEKEGH